MPQFRYRAVVRNGMIDTGVVTALDKESAQKMLRSQRLTLLSLRVVKTLEPRSGRNLQGAPSSETRLAFNKAQRVLDSLKTTRSRPFRAGGISTGHIMRFTSELGVLLRAGLPLDRAIRVQIDTSIEPQYRDLMEGILERLKSGQSFSASLELSPEVFWPFYINMVRSGEASGKLAEVMVDLGLHMEKTQSLRDTVISSLMYPSLLLGVAIISVYVMLGFVVPEFEALFDDMGDSLPILTSLLIEIGDFVAIYGWLLLLGTALVGAMLQRWIQQPRGLIWLDAKLLGLPLVGNIIVKYEVARFARTLGTLIYHGVSMLKAVDISVSTVGNSVLKISLLELTPMIKRGSRLSQSMDPRVFSPVVLQMVRVGEESGSLDKMLLELARITEAEVETEIKRLLTILEPALILGMGGVIAIIIMGILMGILSVNTLVV